MESCPGTPQYRKPMRVKRAQLHRAEMLQAVGHGAEGTCYFQWRAGRGGQEKFHGAVVDHMGNEHTRVFQSVAAVGRLYRRLVPVLGSAPKAEVGLLYDWEARWGLELSGGPDSDDDGYARVAVDHYQPLRELGVAVDVFHSERDFSGYKLLVAPQLWMLKPGVARRLRAFVEGGGTLVATYYTGVCDETNRCFTGGWPGDGLGEVFGLWDEETDVQPPAAVRRVRVAAGAPFAAGRVLRARRVCALVHLRGARALATYAEDFYRGRPALTVNRFGKGRAFYHAAQLEPDGLRAFYGWLARDLGLARDLPAPPPRGVLVQRRAKPGAQFLFLQNFTPKPQRARLGAGSWRDMDTGAAVRNALVLAPFGSAVLQGG